MSRKDNLAKVNEFALIFNDFFLKVQTEITSPVKQIRKFKHFSCNNNYLLALPTLYIYTHFHIVL